MNPTVTAEQVTVRFGGTLALNELTLSLPANRITGLFGRNGAGKSTLMTLIAGYRRPTLGRILVDGADPWEDAHRMVDTVLVRHKVAEESITVTEQFEIAATLRPHWDGDFARSLLDRFDVPRTTPIKKLSTGQRSAAVLIAGLAARAPLTMFDEPHLGMDAPSRYAFYEVLLADYIEHPRTILLSTHIIDEISRVVEDVVIIDRGRLLAHEPVDTLTARGVELTGPAEEIALLTAGRQVLSTRSLGRTVSATVFDGVDEVDVAARAQARARGVDVGPIPLQDLFIALTGAGRRDHEERDHAQRDREEQDRDEDLQERASR